MADLTPAEAAAELAAFAEALANPQPALEQAAASARALVGDSFRGRRAPDGTPWAPRKTTSTRRGRRPYQRTQERPTGRLEASVDVRVEGGKLTFDVPVEYAGFVQEGTGDTEARRFLPFDAAGEPMTSGPAGEFWQRFEDALADKPLEVLGGR